MINKYIRKSNSENYYKNFEDKIIDIDWTRINFNRIAFINKAVTKFKNCKYLEIGCETNVCFNSISTEYKIGIDPNSGGTIRTTSDEFFEKNTNFFDVIFIDGLHTYEQTRKDIVNSLKFLNQDGYIFLHDLIPRSWIEANNPRIHKAWTGDIWKVCLELNKTNGINFSVIIADHGVGVIKKEDKEVIYFDNYSNLINLQFSDYLKKIDEINFLNPREAFEIISK